MLQEILNEYYPDLIKAGGLIAVLEKKFKDIYSKLIPERSSQVSLV